MTEIQQAFAHPEARSLASCPQALADRLSLRDHIVEVEIGAFEVERGIKQRLSFNIVVELKKSTECIEDDVDKILSYDQLTDAITAELEYERLNLLETLAERIAARILQEPQVDRIFLRIEKLDRGGGRLGVEIVRTVLDFQIEEKGKTAAPSAHSAPLVLYLGEDVQNSDKIADFFDALKGVVPPVLLVLELTQRPACVSDRYIQNRIELLSADQKSWMLCAQCSDIDVRGTRTEIDWAFKQGLKSFWAPSKMILDAVSEVGPTSKDWADWLCRELRVERMVRIGGQNADFDLEDIAKLEQLNGLK